MSSITIRENPGRSRFEVLDGAAVIGKAAYLEDGDRRIFYHTVINDEYAGQGLAGRLAEQALNDTVAAGLTIVPVCPYIKKYLGKHPEYAGKTTAPTPAVLDFLDAALAGAARP